MSGLYNTDYHQWLSQQRVLLKERRFTDLDIDNLLDAMEFHMGDVIHELESHLVILLLHLMKYQHQTYVINPQRHEPQDFRSWHESISNARRSITRLMRKNPSLKTRAAKAIEDSYPDAKEDAISQMNQYLPRQQWLDKNSFPQSCPWSFEQIIQTGFLPKAQGQQSKNC